MFKVLIVDDDPFLRLLLCRIVAKLGYLTCEAVNGIQGEQLTFEWKPDAVLLDVMMPLQDGYVTCANLRHKGYSGHILMMSALPDALWTTDVCMYGADTVLRKPLGIDALRNCLTSYFPKLDTKIRSSAPV